MERKGDKKVYHSTLEIEKEFLPKSYEKKIREERHNNPKTFGSDLAEQLSRR
jgi:hypothetical protein